MFYLDKVKQFGDVPWYAQAIEANDSTRLHQPRTSRMIVMDSIISDLDSAIASLPDSRETDRITKWTALALKSRVCPYEGTFRKYQANDPFEKASEGPALTGAEELLEHSAAAANAVRETGP